MKGILRADATPEFELEQRVSREDRYRIGQFFTPPPIAEFMAAAVLANKPETVLDPGVGGGILLRAIGNGPRLYGLDISDEAVVLASEALGEAAQVSKGDFLDPLAWPLDQQSFDAIVSNPPYIRHHNLSSHHKARAAYYSSQFGVKISRLSGSYVYFFLEALLRLNPGGRLVFITPTEFMDVRYGAALKAALTETCEIDDIVVLDMGELAFDGVLTTSAITVATKSEKPTRRVRLVEGRLSTDSVERGREIELGAEVARPELPWTSLLPSRAERLLPMLEGRTATIGDYCKVRRGIATGGNDFFCLTLEQVKELGIEERFIVPVVLGSKDLPANGAPLDPDFRQQRIEAGARAFLFFCHEPRDALKGTRALAHIEKGEQEGLDQKFNCRTRKPWYGVERVPPADYFATYMSRDRARFVRNLVGARCMTSLLNLWARPGIDPEALRPTLEEPTNAVLLKELGRTYGGGLGKIEPGELVSFPIFPVDGAVRATTAQQSLL